ncbi:MAG: MFS transporter [Megasphaera cerevisiae]|nr:MFS transporter [Megasphaera cerevisiae]
MNTRLNSKLIFTMLVLGACWSIVYIIPFIQYIWYDPFKEFINGTNMEMGFLITIYGLGNIWGAPLGGWFADRFNYKYIYVGSVVLNGVFTIAFILNPTYVFAVFIWIGFAFASLFMNYPAHIKIIRSLTTDENQGKIFGFNETFIGVWNIIINMMMMAIYVNFMEGVGGLTAAMLGVGILSIVLGVIVYVVLDNPKKEIHTGGNSNILKDFILVGKKPATWLVAVLVFSIYSFLNTLTYFTPYFTNVLGVTIVFTGWVAILRQHGMTLLGAPVGGVLSDMIQSPAKVLIGVQLVGIIGFVLLLTIPHMTAAILIGLTLLLSAAVYIGRGAYYATITEAGIPRELTASTIGIAAAIGFSPDLFQFTLYGYWLDTFGNAAYTYMFIFQAVVLCVGTLAAIGILKIRKKAALASA